MNDRHINVLYSDDDGAYVADIPDLGACSALGSTAEEAFGRGGASQADVAGCCPAGG